MSSTSGIPDTVRTKEKRNMVKYTVQVEGMQCGMCESHVNDAVRKAFPVKKIKSSHTKKQTILVTEAAIDEEKLRDIINETGYTVRGISSEPYQKHGLFGSKL
jgi:copper chaperone CopZ